MARLEENDMKIKLLIMATALFLSQQSAFAALCPDGFYVGGSRSTLTPSGSYLSGSTCKLQPDGSYTGRLNWGDNIGVASSEAVDKASSL
ncbi:hypothetical protein ACMCNP_04760 [Candidatus Acidulodesulfobacterium sp. H_13]|uniref:hypothetical protein n=1 Tax=Candidatus Acidulodesulfobacterium sp. H_13 TaxID=3395470 RepID=UPI003AF6F43F